MRDLELFLLFVRKLEALNTDYMVTGSVAAILYGEPRLTHDIDIVVSLDRFDAEAFAAAFPNDAYYCPPPEVLIVETKRAERGHFNLIHHESGFKADIYIATHSRFYNWAFEHTKRIDLGEAGMRVAPLEYVLVSKLTFFREGGSQKHIDDIKGMLASGAPVDWSVVESEVQARGLARELSLVRPA